MSGVLIYKRSALKVGRFFLYILQVVGNMTTNPFYNALAAAAYIVAFVSGMAWVGSRLAPLPDTIFAPMVMLSLFVLSAAVMGYLFLYNPLALLVEGKRIAAVKLFLYTVGIFAVFTILIALAALFFF